MHFLLIRFTNNINNKINDIYFISFSIVYVTPVYAVLFIFMMPIGDMSTFLVWVVMKVAGDKVFAFKTYFNEVLCLKVNVNNKVSKS